MQAYITSTDLMSTKIWPGRVSLVIYFAGCDFECPYCLVADKLEFKEEFLTLLRETKREIEENSVLVDSVVFSGGEPCMQRQALLNISTHAKKMNLDVGLETDGSKPQVIKSLIDKKLLDFIALDLKAPLEAEIFEKVTKSKTFFVQTKDVMQQVKESIGVISKNEKFIEIEFRTTIVPGLIYRKEDVLKIAELIQNINCVYVLQAFNPNGNLVNKHLININPPSPAFLQNLKHTILKTYPQMKVEVR